MMWILSSCPHSQIYIFVSFKIHILHRYSNATILLILLTMALTSIRSHLYRQTYNKEWERKTKKKFYSVKCFDCKRFFFFLFVTFARLLFHFSLNEVAWNVFSLFGVFFYFFVDDYISFVYLFCGVEGELKRKSNANVMVTMMNGIVWDGVEYQSMRIFYSSRMIKLRHHRWPFCAVHHPTSQTQSIYYFLFNNYANYGRESSAWKGFFFV